MRRHALVFFTLVLLFGNDLYPGTLTVCESGCDHDSIQAAVDAAVSGDTIEIGPGTYFENVRVGSISLTIEGAGRELTIVDGRRAGTVFHLFGSSPTMTDVRLAGMTIRNALGSGVCLGGFTPYDGYVSATLDGLIIRDNVGRFLSHPVCWASGVAADIGELTINDTVIAGNREPTLGGVYLYQTKTTIDGSTIENNDRSGVSTRELFGFWNRDLTISNSTISGNTGDGISLYYAYATISNSTISGNAGDGISIIAGSEYFSEATLTNTTIAGNGLSGIYADPLYPVFADLSLDHSIIADNGLTECENVVTDPSLGHNLASDDSCDLARATDLPNTDPDLLPLRDNGGRSPTHVPGATSPAVDAGDVGCGTPDQRGFARPVDGDGDGTSRCDIGAVEFQGDGDDDGVEDPVDCAPGDPALWRLPGEVRSLEMTRSGATTTLWWSAPTEPGAATILYDTLRSEAPDDFVTAGLCVESDGADTFSTDGDLPSLVFHYLVRAKNGCGDGPGGLTSSGAARALPVCP